MKLKFATRPVRVIIRSVVSVLVIVLMGIVFLWWSGEWRGDPVPHGMDKESSRTLDKEQKNAGSWSKNSANTSKRVSNKNSAARGPAGKQAEKSKLVYVKGEKYPWHIESAGASGGITYVADHVMVWAEKALTPAAITMLKSEGYKVRMHRDELYLIAWETPSAQAFPMHEAEVQSMVPSVVVDKDYKIRSLAEGASGIEEVWPNTEEDLLGLSWLYENDYSASGILVAVIDSGVNRDHADLKKAIYQNPGEEMNGEDDDGNGYADDLHGYNFVNQDTDSSDDEGHGTAIAGIVAATGNNGVGTAGFAPQAKILPVKILNASGNGYTSDAVLGIKYAGKLQSDVINASWGGEGDSEILKEVILKYIDDGGIFVTAAGNSGQYLDTHTNLPASLDIPGMIVVGGYRGRYESMAPSSNYSKTKVDILAPWSWPVLDSESEEVLQDQEGTSLSAAIVSGIMATLKKNFPEISTDELRNRMYETASFAYKTRHSVRYPGYPQYTRIFENERATKHKIIGHTLSPEEFYLNESVEIELQVSGSGDYVIFGELPGSNQIISDTNKITATVKMAEESHLDLTISGLLGESEYKPIPLIPKMSKPHLIDSLPVRIDVADLEGPMTLTPNAEGNLPIHTTWYYYDTDMQTSRLSISEDIDLGIYRLMLRNSLGTDEHELEIIYNNQRLVEQSKGEGSVIPAGDMSGQTLVEFQDFPYWYDTSGRLEPVIGDDVEAGRLVSFWSGDGFAVVKMEDGLFLIQEDGVMQVDAEIRTYDNLAGVFGNEIVFDTNPLTLVNLETGGVRTIELNGEIAPLPGITLANGDRIVHCMDSGIWRYTESMGWKKVFSKGFEYGQGLCLDGKFVFYSDTGAENEETRQADLFISDDGQNWQHEKASIHDFLTGRLFFELDGRIATVWTRRIYTLDLDSMEWSKLNDQLIPTDSAFDRGHVTYMNIPELNKLNLVTVPNESIEHMRIHGDTVYGQHRKGLLRTQDFKVWEVLFPLRGILTKNGEDLYYFTSEEILKISTDGTLTKMGDGIMADSIAISSRFFFAQKRDWQIRSPESGEWSALPYDRLLQATDNVVFATHGNTLVRFDQGAWTTLLSDELPGLAGYAYDLEYLVSSEGGKLYLPVEKSATNEQFVASSKNGIDWDLESFEYPSDDGRFVLNSGSLYYTNNSIHKFFPEEGWKPVDSYQVDSPVEIKFRGFRATGSSSNYKLLEDVKRLPSGYYDVLPLAKYSGESSWYSDDTFGWFWAQGEKPLLWSQEHEWLYFKDLPKDAAAFYDRELGWWFYSPERYPNIYRYATGEWMFYLKGTTGERWFYHYKTGEWKAW